MRDASCEAVFPLAINDTVGTALELLVKVTIPVEGPALGGVKETDTGWLVPPAKVKGNAGLVIANPVPLTVPANTVVVFVDGFESVTF